MPNLENAMYNFTRCSVLMFASSLRYAISYKNNQPSFQIFTRKQFHNFKVVLNNANHEQAYGATLPKRSQYIISNILTVQLFDQKTMEVIQTFEVPAKHPGSQILYSTVSPSDQKLGFAIGHKIIKDKDYITDIVIFKRKRNGLFKLEKSRDFPYHDACPRFIFNKHIDTELLFYSSRYVFEIDYILEEDTVRNVFYKIKNTLDAQP